MFNRMLAALVLGLVLAPGALAHGPTPQSAEETVTIAASADAVWAVLKDFASLASWHPLVAACSGKGDERNVTLKSGGVLVDSLDEVKAGERSYSYRLLRENIEAFPVSFYTATVVVKPTGADTSEVTWSAHFYRGDTTNEPPDSLNDAAAVAAMKNFFSTGLKGLKEEVEKR